jgi:hypothetical protein
MKGESKFLNKRTAMALYPREDGILYEPVILVPNRFFLLFA